MNLREEDMPKDRIVAEQTLGSDDVHFKQAFSIAYKCSQREDFDSVTKGYFNSIAVLLWLASGKVEEIK